MQTEASSRRTAAAPGLEWWWWLQGGLLCSSLGLDVALQSAGGPGASSVDVCPGLQVTCFVRAQPPLAPDTAPSLNQESAGE